MVRPLAVPRTSAALPPGGGAAVAPAEPTAPPQEHSPPSSGGVGALIQRFSAAGGGGASAAAVASPVAAAPRAASGPSPGSKNVPALLPGRAAVPSSLSKTATTATPTSRPLRSTALFPKTTPSPQPPSRVVAAFSSSSPPSSSPSSTKAASSSPPPQQQQPRPTWAAANRKGACAEQSEGDEGQPTSDAAADQQPLTPTSSTAAGGGIRSRIAAFEGAQRSPAATTTKSPNPVIGGRATAAGRIAAPSLPPPPPPPPLAAATTTGPSPRKTSWPPPPKTAAANSAPAAAAAATSTGGGRAAASGAAEATENPASSDTKPLRLGGTYLYRVGGTAGAGSGNVARRFVEQYGSSGAPPPPSPAKVGGGGSPAPASGQAYAGKWTNRVPEVDGLEEKKSSAPAPPSSTSRFRARTFPATLPSSLSSSKPLSGVNAAPPPAQQRIASAAATLPPPQPPDFGDLSPIPDDAFASSGPPSLSSAPTSAAAVDPHRLQLPDDSLTDEEDQDEATNTARRRDVEEPQLPKANQSQPSSGGTSRFKVLSHKHASTATSSSFQNRLYQFSQSIAANNTKNGKNSTKAQSGELARSTSAPSSRGPVVRPGPPTPPENERQHPTDVPDSTAEDPTSTRISPRPSSHKVLSASKHASDNSAFQNRLLQFSQKLPSSSGVPTRRPVPLQPAPSTTQKAQLHARHNLDPNLMPSSAGCHSLEPTEETSIGSTTDTDPDDPQLDLSLDDARVPVAWDKGDVVPLASLCDVSSDLPTPVRTRDETAAVVTPPSPRPPPGAASHVQRLRNAFEVAISPAAAASTASPPAAEVSQEGFEVAAAHDVSGSSESSAPAESHTLEVPLGQVQPSLRRPIPIEGELDALLASQEVYADPPLTLPDDSTHDDSLTIPPVAAAIQKPHSDATHKDGPRSKPASLSLLARKPSHGEGPPIPPGAGDGRGPRSGSEPPADDTCVFESYDGLSSSGQLSVQRLASALFTEEALIISATSPRVMKEDWEPRSKEGRAKAGLPPAGEGLCVGVARPAGPRPSPEEDLLEASLEPPSTVRKTPPRSDAVLMRDLDFLAPAVADSSAPESAVAAVQSSDDAPPKAAMKKLLPNPKDTARSKGRTRCGPNSDESQGACPVATAVDRSASGGKAESSQSRIRMLASVLSSPDPGEAEADPKGNALGAPGFPALANESLAHETPASTAGDTGRSGPVDLDDTVEDSFENSKEHDSFPISSVAENEDPFHVDYAGLITKSATLEEPTEPAAPPNTSNLRLAPNPKDTARSTRPKSRSVTINANPEYVAVRKFDHAQTDDDFDVHHESSSSQPESVATSVSAESPSKADQSPNWKVTRPISQTSPMWTALDGEERIKKWRQLRRRQSEGNESSYSYSEEYESTATSDQDSDGRPSARPKPDQQWQLFNPMDAKKPLVAYYEPPSVLRPRKIEKGSKRSTRPTRKSPRTVPPVSSGMMVEI